VSAVGAGVLIPVMVEENAEARADTNREVVTVPVSIDDKVVEQRIETLDRTDVLSSGENVNPHRDH
jgi:hypothetical protein